MKAHPNLTDKEQDVVLERSKALELQLINYDSPYRIYKLGSKNGGDIELNQTKCVGRGYVLLTGTEDYVCLLVSGMREWYRTSPVQMCWKNKKSIVIETLNSFYELVEDE